jgi:ribosomal protein S18 acetylase RimI-like enzyme
MAISFTFAGPGNAADFQCINVDLFDNSVSPASLKAFLHDDRHHIAIAKDGGAIVGFVSAVDYVHPDKPRELWINEVGVAGSWRGKGIAKQLLSMMLTHGRNMGCAEAWVVAERENGPANGLYRSVANEADAEPMSVILHSFKLA